MKNQFRMISVLLVLILCLSLFGAGAFADAVAVSGGETIGISVSVDRVDGDPASYLDAEGSEVYLEPYEVLLYDSPVSACTVSAVDRNNQEAGMGYESLYSLLNADAGIQIVPADGYYISELCLSAGEKGYSPKNLLSAATANLYSPAITFYPGDIATTDGYGGYTLDGDYLSSWGSAYTLYISCRKISPDMHTVTYTSNGSQVDSYSDYGNWTHGVIDAFSAVYPPDGMEADGLYLRYNGDDGAVRRVYPGDPISVYLNAEIELCWKEAESVPEETGGDTYVEETWTDNNYSGDYDTQYSDNGYSDGMTEDFVVYGDSYASNDYVPAYTPPTVPAVTITGWDLSEAYNGSAHGYQDGSVSYSVEPQNGLGDYHLYVTYNRITDPSTTDSILDYALYDANNTLVFSRAELDSSGVFHVNPGTLTVYDAIPQVKITGYSDSKEYDGYPLTVPDGAAGYTVTEGSLGSYYSLGISFNSIDRVGSVPTIANYALFNPYGQVVFDKNALDSSGVFIVDPGTLTITERAPTVPAVTIIGVTDSKKFDGTALTKDSSNGFTVSPEGGLGDYVFNATFGTITNVGSTPTIDTTEDYNLSDKDGQVVFTKQQLVDSGVFTIIPGTLTITEADPVIPAVTITGVTDSKKFDGTPLTKDSTNGFTVSPEGGLGDYVFHATFGTITNVGSTPTIDTTEDYNLRDKDGQVVFTKQQLVDSGVFTVVPGTLTVTEADPVIPTVTIQGANDSKQYDGTALTKDSTNGYIVSPADGLGSFKLKLTFGTVTDPGSVDTITDYALCDQNDNVVFTKQQLDNSPNFVVDTGRLTVSKRHLKITAISGEINSHGETFTAAGLSTQDGSFTNGFKAEGLLTGHNISGVVVNGQGSTSFETSVNVSNVRISDASNWDATSKYDIDNIETVKGYITIHDLTPPAPNTYTLNVNPKSYTWTYDGKDHKLAEYDVSGLVDGDRIDRVNFKDTAVIRDVGTVYNEITSVEVSTATGGNVADGKYKLNSIAGTLNITPRDVTVTAISGTLSNTEGKEVIASQLSKPDENFRSGYKVEGLAEGHSLVGNFVTGRGTTTFNTGIDSTQLRIVDAYNVDVTRNYRITTVPGTITITSSTPARSNVPLTLTAKSTTFPYDGNDHSYNEYEAVGLVDGDRIEKVTFKPTSVIRNAGTQPNEIQSVVIKSASGGAVDNSKYSIRYVPGTLTVVKAPLTLTAVSDSKTYDGKALTNKNVKASALANASHKLSADYEVFDSNGNTIKNGPVDPGTYTKKVSNVKITASGQDVTSNYEIKMIDGTLTITGTGTPTSRSTTSTAYYGSTYTIRSDAPYAEFRYLLIDGQKVASDNYTLKEGSTIITLKSSYIQSLKAGNHNYSIVSANSQVDGTFNVARAPRTGDGARAVLWIVLLLIAAIAVALAFFFLKRSGKLPAKGSGKKPAPQKATGPQKTAAPQKTAPRRTVARPVVKNEEEEEVTPEAVLNFDKFDRQEPVKEKDPTSDLVKDFTINLDDYRDPAAKPADELPDIEVEIYEEPPRRGKHEKP